MDSRPGLSGTTSQSTYSNFAQVYRQFNAPIAATGRFWPEGDGHLN